MVSLDDAVIARLESHGMRFEILVDPELALEFKEEQGKTEVELDDLLAANFVFADARAGDKAGEGELNEAFGTTDLEPCVHRILLKGDLQLTTDQRRRMTEQKRRAIVMHIVRHAINPQTKTPHPPARIETAMEEARVHVDPFKSVEAQVQDVVKVLRPLIPLRFENVTIAVKLSPTDAPKVYQTVRQYGDLKKEEWQGDGSWVGLIEMPAGMQTEFYTELNKKTGGSAETKIINQST